MLTNDEIRALAKVNLNVCKAALDQTEKRLADILDVRKASDSKQTSLFSAFIGFAMAVCGIGAALAQKPEYATYSGVFFLASVPFGVGALIFLIGLWPTQSAYLGSHPDDWLQRELIGAVDDSPLAVMYADLVINVANRLNVASQDISHKHQLTMAGMVCGIFGMVGFAAALLALPRG